MSDLISRQAVIDAIEPILKSILQGDSFKAINVMYRIRNLPSARPTVDAVEVVRCRDCRWYDHICWRVETEFGENDYCSYGERGNDKQCQR